MKCAWFLIRLLFAVLIMCFIKHKEMPIAFGASYDPKD